MSGRPRAHARAPGRIDPWLRALSFWENERAAGGNHLVRDASDEFYGDGEVSADFIGWRARDDRQRSRTSNPDGLLGRRRPGNTMTGRRKRGRCSPNGFIARWWRRRIRSSTR
jgi:hypothetical protein